MRRLLTIAALAALSVPLTPWPGQADDRATHHEARADHHPDGRFEPRDFHRGGHDRLGFDFSLGGPVYPAPVYPPLVYEAPPPVYSYPAPPYAYNSPQPVPGVVVREGRDSAGNYCRQYENTTYVNGQAVASYTTACLRPDGVWQIVG